MEALPASSDMEALWRHGQISSKVHCFYRNISKFLPIIRSSVIKSREETMGKETVNINDIKPVENFLLEGCYYSEAEDGSVNRSCDELRADFMARLDAQLKAGADPAEIAEKEAIYSAKVDAYEADAADTLKEYKNVINSQTKIISFFKANIDAIKSAKIQNNDDNSDWESECVYARIVTDAFKIDFSDSDGDGELDGINIGPNHKEVDSGNWNIVPVYWPCQLKLVPIVLNNPQTYASDRFSWLYGDDFTPLISALVSLHPSYDASAVELDPIFNDIPLYEMPSCEEIFRTPASPIPLSIDPLSRRVNLLE